MHSYAINDVASNSTFTKVFRVTSFEIRKRDVRHWNKTKSPLKHKWAFCSGHYTGDQ